MGYVEHVVVCVRLVTGYTHAVVAISEEEEKVIRQCDLIHDECADHMECEVAKDWVLIRMGT